MPLNCVLMMESGIFDFEPTVPLNHIADCLGLPRVFLFHRPFYQLYDDLSGIRRCLFSGCGAKSTNFGNLNTTVIGEYDAPKIKLPGSGGAADFMSYAKRTILTLRGRRICRKASLRNFARISGRRRQPGPDRVISPKGQGQPG